MSALPRRRRNRTLAMLAATVVVALSVPALGYVGVKAVLDSTGGRDATADNLEVQSFPTTPSGLFLTTNAQGTLASATVFVLAPSGVGGSIVSVPVNADVGLASNARRSLQQVFAAGGVDATVPAIESMLLVSISYSSVADPDQLVQFLAPYQPFTVQLTSTVPGDGDGQGSLPAGDAVLQASSAARVFTAGLSDDAPADPQRQANIDAMWTAVVASIGSGRAPATPISGGPTTFDDLVVHLVAAQTQSRGLSAAALTGAENPNDLDVVEVDRSEAVLVFASIAPGSMLAPAIGPVIRLEAPPGYDLQLKLTIDKLLFLTANVVSINSTAEAHPDTVFLVPDEANRLIVQSTDEIFGDITFGTPTVRIESVDVTIQLGTDYLDGLPT